MIFLVVISLLFGFGTAETFSSTAFNPKHGWCPCSPWNLKTPPMVTPWTYRVSVDAPWPEYPRPQMTRPDWMNLNGLWDFEMTATDAGQPEIFTEKIRVPFPVESALSGIQRKVSDRDKLWYKRTFTIPEDWNSRNVQLHFGGSDWLTTVWINGQQAGEPHKGCYDEFTYDITSLLDHNENTIVVSVWDPTNNGSQPLGKQLDLGILPHPGAHYRYSPSSGIWQTVWLEPTPPGHITRLDMIPHLSDSTLRITVRGTGITSEIARITVSIGENQIIGTTTGSVGSELRVHVENPHLWSPDDPFLYNVKAELVANSSTTDVVSSYAGMRSVSVGTVDGKKRILLNGKFVFQNGILVQGYWPDGIYTAPTDDALKYDLQKIKNFGFNMVRMHQKVEPQRWYYWADHLGLLVHQEMPSLDKTPDDTSKPLWDAEFKKIISEHLSSPAIIIWVDQNHRWGQPDQGGVVDMIRATDPSRLVSSEYGSKCCSYTDAGKGDIMEDTRFVVPTIIEPTSTKAAVLGFGNMGLRVEHHEWSPGSGASSENLENTGQYNDRLVGMIEAIRVLLLPRGLSSSIFVGFGDIENEIFGMLTYDRQVVKVNEKSVKAANQALIEASKNLVPPLTLPEGLISLRATTQASSVTNWYIREKDGLAYIEFVDSNSDQTLKQKTTWRVVPGLADSSCYSFELPSDPGRFLRHTWYRIRCDHSDGSEWFPKDATFCPVPGEGGIRLMSQNHPSGYIRHYNAELYLAVWGGSRSSDAQFLFVEDTTFVIEKPWAP